jgi:1,4-dihydroxy-6-naphthoate synthase
MTALSLAFSSCPNDTFVFDAWVNGRLVVGSGVKPGDGSSVKPGDKRSPAVSVVPPVEVTYADVDVTNTTAQQDGLDIVKVSYAALPWLLDRYELLPCGGALGRGCGPLVLTRGDRDSLDGARVAVPGERTTAYLLMRLWAAGHHPATIDVVPFAEIMPAVRAGRYDAGLVIHEARFTYHQYGLTALADLGEWWEADTGLAIPLGAILARRDLAARTGVTADQAAAIIRASVRYAWSHPHASAAYVAAHAQEMDPDVQRRHIELYVNEFTEDLGSDGYAAIEALLGRAHAAGLIPPTPALR